MAKICFTSVCTNDSYSYYIPLFVYTIKRAYPNAGVKVFVKGRLKDVPRETLKLIPYEGWTVKDQCFKDFPDKSSITNSLRFLIDKKEFKGYDYIMIRDIDFLMFPHKVSHADYFIRRMKRMRVPYYGIRGPYSHPRRYNINRIGWRRDFTRIAGGTVVVKNPDWFDKTLRMRGKYRHYLKHNMSDGFDSHKPASYREYDEVMLYRIMKKSGLKIPRRKNKDILGKSAPKRYRDIHLGDFGKRKHGYKRLVSRLASENAKEFIKLESDPVWKEIKDRMRKNGKIREIIRRVRRHVKRRLKKSTIRQLRSSSSSGEGTVEKQLKNA